MLTSLLLLLSSAWADCPGAELAVRRAEEDALSYFLADANLGLDEAARAFGCQPVERSLLVRYWLAKGLVWQLQGDERATVALATARALDPDQFTDDFGDELRALWADTAPAPTSPALPIRMRGLAKDDEVLVDLQPVDPVTSPPGLHLVQVRRAGTIVFGRIIVAEPDSSLTLSLAEVPVSAGPTPETSGTGLDYAVPLPLELRGARVFDANGERLDFSRTVLPAATLATRGRDLLARRRRNLGLQGLAVSCAAGAAYGTYLAGYRTLTSDEEGAWGTAAMAGGLATLASVGWEMVLLRRRAHNRRDLVDQAGRGLGGP